MNLPDYINSGVLELYVLDRLAPDERRRVESYVDQYPEVKEELTEIEVALEQYALLQGQITPPPAAALAAALTMIPATGAGPATGSPLPPAPASAAPTPRKNANPLTWLLCIALALALGGLVYFMTQASERSEDVEEVEQRFTTLEADCERIRDANLSDRQQLALLSDPDTRGVVLEGQGDTPNSRAVVFYNQQSGEVLFSAANLPAPPTGRQYQLWAIDANGPQDLGVLDRDLDDNTLIDVRFVPNTATFAITLEEAGGKPTPDLTQLQVIGNVEG